MISHRTEQICDGGELLGSDVPQEVEVDAVVGVGQDDSGRDQIGPRHVGC